MNFWSKQGETCIQVWENFDKFSECLFAVSVKFDVMINFISESIKCGMKLS